MTEVATTSNVKHPKPQTPQVCIGDATPFVHGRALSQAKGPSGILLLGEAKGKLRYTAHWSTDVDSPKPSLIVHAPINRAPNVLLHTSPQKNSFPEAAAATLKPKEHGAELIRLGPKGAKGAQISSPNPGAFQISGHASH